MSVKDGRRQGKPRRDPPSGKWEEHVGRLLMRAFRAFDRELTARLRERGSPDVRPGHGAVFAHIDPQGTRLTDLAERAEMTEQSMGELVQDLERKGYLLRQIDPADSRARLVSFTERGRQNVRQALRIIRQMEQEYARRLGRERLETLRAILRELTGRD